MVIERQFAAAHLNLRSVTAFLIRAARHGATMTYQPAISA